MRYNEQINLKLYTYTNNAFTLQAIIDDYQEISFAHNLYEAGDFTITINYNIPNALKFERGMFIQFGNDSYMFGEILTISDSIGEDGKGSQTRTITGKDARYIFKRRVIKNLNNEENWAMTDKGEICLRELVKAQCGAAAEAKRQLPVANTIPSSASAIGKEYSVAEAFSNLYDTLVTIATQSEIGWRIKFDGTLTLEVFQGSDLSNQVQFSTDFDSLANGEFTDSAESYANTVYVAGKGTGSDRDIYEGEQEIEGASPSALDRYEAYDNQSQMTSESEYEAEALSMLTQYGQTLTMSGNGLAKCPYIFKEQYNIGDTITLAFSGKSAKAQILSVTENWTWGQYGISFSFGKPQNDLSRQLQLILKQIQKASNKTTSTSSVKYYTIPTDTQMPKADVIYDTIGFEGTCADGGSTFQLYWDSEKTGAKNYHVWLKQLGGGKLTLTTGVSGASNLVLNSGTYVAIIYVDQEGNVLSQGATPTDTIAVGNNQPATSSGVASAISSAVGSPDVSNATGVLPVANGGTGQTTQADTNKAIVGALESASADVTDGTEFISSNATDNGFAETNEGGPNKPYKRQFIKVWNYIKSKIQSIALNPIHIAKGGSIYADGTKADYPIIKMKDNTSDAYGNGIVIGGGGAVVIGAGESADTYYNGAGLTAGDENTRITSDNNIYFAANCNNSYASRQEMTLDTSGNLTVPSGVFASSNVLGSNLPIFGTCYSGSTNSGYFLLAQLETSASSGNHDISMIGSVIWSPAGSYVTTDFYIYVRGNNGTVQASKFNLVGYNSVAPLTATFEVFSTNRFRIRLYGQITGNWQRYHTYIKFASGGDVVDRISNRTVTFPSSQSSSVTGTVISKNYTIDANITGSSGSCTGNAATSTNADKVDGYHVSTAAITTQNNSLNSLVPVAKHYALDGSSVKGGYIVFSNKLMICWGCHFNSGGNVEQTVNYTTESGGCPSFASATNYIVNATYYNTEGGTYYYATNIKSKSTTSFVITSHSDFNSNTKFYWCAIGYVS